MIFPCEIPRLMTLLGVNEYINQEIIVPCLIQTHVMYFEHCTLLPFTDITCVGTNLTL